MFPQQTVWVIVASYLSHLVLQKDAFEWKESST